MYNIYVNMLYMYIYNLHIATVLYITIASNSAT